MAFKSLKLGKNGGKEVLSKPRLLAMKAYAYYCYLLLSAFICPTRMGYMAQ